MPDAGIRQILESDEPLTCQECDFRGRLSDLERQGRSDGWEPLTCPSCGQDHYLFGPDPISKPLSLGEQALGPMHGFEYYGPVFARWLSDQAGKPIRFEQVEPGDERSSRIVSSASWTGFPSLLALRADEG